MQRIHIHTPDKNRYKYVVLQNTLTRFAIVHVVSKTTAYIVNTMVLILFRLKMFCVYLYRFVSYFTTGPYETDYENFVPITGKIIIKWTVSNLNELLLRVRKYCT